MQLLHEKGQQTLGYLHSEFSIKVTGMSFFVFTLVTEGALIIFFSRKKTAGALIRAGALNGANTVCLTQCKQALQKGIFSKRKESALLGANSLL